MARSGSVGVPLRRDLVRNRVIVAIALSSMLASYNAAADESAAVAEAREAIASFRGSGSLGGCGWAQSNTGAGIPTVACNRGRL